MSVLRKKKCEEMATVSGQGIAGQGGPKYDILDRIIRYGFSKRMTYKLWWEKNKKDIQVYSGKEGSQAEGIQQQTQIPWGEQGGSYVWLTGSQ